MGGYNYLVKVIGMQFHNIGIPKQVNNDDTKNANK